MNEKELKLTESEVEFVYSKLKAANDIPADLLTKLQKIIKDHDVDTAELYEQNLLKQFDESPLLQKVYRMIPASQGRGYSKLDFMKHVSDGVIRVFNDTDEWFDNYIERYDSMCYKYDLKVLAKMEIHEHHVGRKVQDILLPLADENIYLVDGKHVEINI